MASDAPPELVDPPPRLFRGTFYPAAGVRPASRIQIWLMRAEGVYYPSRVRGWLRHAWILAVTPYRRLTCRRCETPLPGALPDENYVCGHCGKDYPR